MADRGQGQGGERKRSGRGFAGMDDQRRREIARQGGKASSHSQRRDEHGQFAGRSARPGGETGGSRDGSRGRGGSTR